MTFKKVKGMNLKISSYYVYIQSIKTFQKVFFILLCKYNQIFFSN